MTEPRQRVVHVSEHRVLRRDPHTSQTSVMVLGANLPLQILGRVAPHPVVSVQMLPTLAASAGPQTVDQHLQLDCLFVVSAPPIGSLT